MYFFSNQLYYLPGLQKYFHFPKIFTLLKQRDGVLFAPMEEHKGN